MKLTLLNQIRYGEEVELLKEVYEVTYQVKGDYAYLLYKNDEGERVVLKFNDQELTMSRFSKPQSILRFVKDQAIAVNIPTPMGLQPFLTETALYQLDAARQTLQLHYQLKQLSQPEQTDQGQVFATYEMTLTWA